MTAELTTAQRAAAEAPESRVLVIAPAGSGKTAVLIERVRHLVDTGTAPEDIVAITYTNAAAREIEARLAMQLGFSGTLHRFCLKHIRDFVQPGYEIRVIDDEEKGERLLQAAQEAGVKVSLKALLARQAEWLVTTGRPEDPIEIAVKRYQSESARMGLLDYNTVLMIAKQSLQHPDRPRAHWSHLLIDEWQDAAEIDWFIYAHTDTKNYFAVGDPMQSIFAFRENWRGYDFGRALTHDWAKYYLQENWRSTPEICAAATSLAGKAREPVQKPLISLTDSGAAVRCRSFTDAPTEAVAIAHSITSSEGSLDTAVLTRTNAVADYIVNVMAGYSIKTRRLIETPKPPDWRAALAGLGWLARPDSVLAATRFAELKCGRTVPPDGRLEIITGKQVTGDADKLAEELMGLGISYGSRKVIEARFKELPETATLLDLEAALVLEGAGRQEIGDPDGVFVGTIHSAKGREFDRVILAGFEDELIPGTGKNRDVEEERRIAYVGVTRARKELLITWAKTRPAPYGRHWPQKHEPSRFIAEMGL